MDEPPLRYCRDIWKPCITGTISVAPFFLRGSAIFKMIVSVIQWKLVRSYFYLVKFSIFFFTQTERPPEICCSLFCCAKTSVVMLQLLLRRAVAAVETYLWAYYATELKTVICLSLIKEIVEENYNSTSTGDASQYDANLFCSVLKVAFWLEQFRRNFIAQNNLVYTTLLSLPKNC